MFRRNTDSEHIVESLEECMEESDEGKLRVWDSEARMIALTREEMEEWNQIEHSESLFTFEWESCNRLIIHFHERIVDNEFCLNPAGPRAIDPVQATQPEDLSNTLGEIIPEINEELGIHKWDFYEVKGASIANGGHITDFEFKYDTFINF